MTGCPVPSRVGEGGGEILRTHVYHNKEERWCVLILGSVLFLLVTPPLQPGVVGSYLIWGVWFSNHLLLEGTSHI
jgi:hypothetical protein